MNDETLHLRAFMIPKLRFQIKSSIFQNCWSETNSQQDEKECQNMCLYHSVTYKTNAEPLQKSLLHT